MTIQYNGVSIPASFASCSITSKSGDGLIEKMKSIKNAGFDGMEMSMADIVASARAQVDADVGEEDIEH